MTPRAAPSELAACRALVDRLPSSLGDVPRRTTTDVATTAAWGDPPVVLACGGASGSTRDDAFSVDGMRFALHDVGAARTWTTLDRRPAVVVTFPDRYENQGELVGYLVPALSR